MKIIIVAAEDFVSPSARRAWAASGVEIVGPITPEKLDAKMLAGASGVLLDVSLDASVLFEASETLMLEEVAFLFVVSHAMPESAAKPFVVNDDPEDMQAVFEALARESHGGQLH
ncbi:hypothetical protein J2858_002580 [Neorhizobium galegae]|uniref:hypothetical protein n=1 Tax=Neorhizobium galegae TaxID=399 RepID=UPI001AE5F020|nr:hypothetical protein [Neorhizobium galegae]MBP2549657.1 hypothetical protein [Neorhizobium galegae]